MASTLKINNIDTASGSTITIPTGKVMVGTDGGTFKSPDQIIQQVHSAINTQATTTSNTFVDTTLNVTITPKYNNSKILILGAIHLYQDTNNSVAAMTVKRGSTNLGHSNWGLGYIYQSAGGAMVATLPLNHLDSPATTSATTYTVQFSRASTGTGTAYICINGTPTSLTALEIAQ